MRIRDLAATAALLAASALPVEAQATRDQARLVFTISGASIQGRGLWSVASQPVQDAPDVDIFTLSRSVQTTLGAAFSGTYYPGDNLGLGVDFVLLGLGYDDACRLAGPLRSASNAQVCDNIDQQEKSAAAVTVSAGATYRFFSRELISPFARVNAGLLFSNQSSLLTQGFDNDGVLLVVYDDEKRGRVTPSFSVGVGATTPIGRAYHLRWEVRDNIVGIESVAGPAPGARTVPPHERRYKHLFSILIGIDVLLERDRGRRY